MSNLLVPIKQAFQSLRSNLGRTTLTTLGVVIGISTVILVLSAGEGFRSLINAQIAAFGSNTLFIQTHVPATTKNRVSANQGEGNNSAFNGVTITSFKPRDLIDVRRLPNVLGAYGMVTGQAVVSYRNTEKSTIYYGAAAERFAIDQHTLKEGRFYTTAEDTGAAQVVILGVNLAKNLFGQSEALGQLIRVGNLNFEVVGVYNPQGFAGGGIADDTLYMPLNTAQKKMLGIDYLTIGVVQVKDVNLSDMTAEDIKTTLARNHNITNPDKRDFLVQTQTEALSSFNTIFGGVTLLLIAIAAISLVVGGVGIMNIMYVVVTERTAEIGLKKALGATYKNILNEFLIESVVVTLIGGVLGIVLGALLGLAVASIASATGLTWQFSVPLYSIGLGCGVSAFIGIVFGVLPARSAARLDPIEALRYE